MRLLMIANILQTKVCIYCTSQVRLTRSWLTMFIMFKMIEMCKTSCGWHHLLMGLGKLLNFYKPLLNLYIESGADKTFPPTTNVSTQHFHQPLTSPD